jgi:hypothetical protein
MKKFIFILMLCAFQPACSGHQPRSESGPVLLSFEQLSSEILITVEDTAEESDSTPTLATAM